MIPRSLEVITLRNWIANPRRICVLVTRFVLGLIVATAACATAGNTGHPASTSSGRASSNDNRQITREEIENAHQPTLFDVVRALRSNWLRVSSAAVSGDQTSGIAVYLDEQYAGGLDVLRQMGSNSATALRFYGKTEAQSRFGVDYMQGLIQVITARGSREH